MMPSIIRAIAVNLVVGRGTLSANFLVNLVFIQLFIWVSGLGLELDKNIDGAFCELLTMIFCHNWTEACPADPLLFSSSHSLERCSILSLAKTRSSLKDQ